jgi:hypothetical protein
MTRAIAEKLETVIDKCRHARQCRSDKAAEEILKGAHKLLGEACREIRQLDLGAMFDGRAQIR